MKKQSLHPAFLWVVIPTLVLLFAMVVIRPAPPLEMGQMFRPQDASCTLWAFQVGIRDNALVQSNYTVRTGEGTYTTVIRLEGSDQPEVFEHTAADSLLNSALTLSQAKELIEPVWQAMLQEMPGAGVVSVKLIPPREVKPALTDMTLGVSGGRITPVTEPYSETTDYGMIEARVSDEDMTVTLTKYLMLIP